MIIISFKVMNKQGKKIQFILVNNLAIITVIFFLEVMIYSGEVRLQNYKPIMVVSFNSQFHFFMVIELDYLDMMNVNFTIISTKLPQKLEVQLGVSCNYFMLLQLMNLVIMQVLIHGYYEMKIFFKEYFVYLKIVIIIFPIATSFPAIIFATIIIIIIIIAIISIIVIIITIMIAIIIMVITIAIVRQAIVIILAVGVVKAIKEVEVTTENIFSSIFNLELFIVVSELNYYLENFKVPFVNFESFFLAIIIAIKFIASITLKIVEVGSIFVKGLKNSIKQITLTCCTANLEE